MGRRTRVLECAPDGVAEVEADRFYREWQVIAARVVRAQSRLYISLPREFAETIGLRPGEWVLVAVKRPTPGELSEYLELVDRRTRRGRVPPSLVQCPECGRPGYWKLAFYRRLGKVIAYVYHPQSRSKCYVRSGRLP